MPLRRRCALTCLLLALVPACDAGDKPPPPGSGGGGQGGTGGGASGGGMGTGQGGVQAVCPQATAAPEMVKDATPGSDGSWPTRWFTNGCVTYFNVVRPQSINELWRTDGTAAGTAPLNAPPLFLGQPHALGDLVIFDDHDRLMRTDGISASVLLDGWALPNFLFDAEVMGDRLFLNARDAEKNGDFVTSQYGLEPWVTDGTAAGTKVFVDTQPGEAPVVGGPVGFSVAGSALYFWMDGYEALPQLWRSDGTSGGTQPILDGTLSHAVIEGAPAHTGGLAVGDKLFFLGVANDEFGLWVTNGTAAGTTLLAQLNQPGGPLGSVYVNEDHFALTELAGKVYLLASPRLYALGEGMTSYYGPPIEALWSTDGTAAGTALVAEIPHQEYTPWASLPFRLVATGDHLYFLSMVDSADGGRAALFASDGTAAGLAPVGTFDLVTELVRMGDAVYLAASTPDTGQELFRSAGTPATTGILADIAPGPASADVSELTVAGGRLVFSANDGVHGAEPWTSDGTLAGTALAQDIRPGASSSSPQGFTVLGDVVLFSADDGVHGAEPWKM